MEQQSTKNWQKYSSGTTLNKITFRDLQWSHPVHQTTLKTPSVRLCLHNSRTTTILWSRSRKPSKPTINIQSSCICRPQWLDRGPFEEALPERLGFELNLRVKASKELWYLDKIIYVISDPLQSNIFILLSSRFYRWYVCFYYLYFIN